VCKNRRQEGRHDARSVRAEKGNHPLTDAHAGRDRHGGSQPSRDDGQLFPGSERAHGTTAGVPASSSTSGPESLPPATTPVAHVATLNITHDLACNVTRAIAHDVWIDISVLVGVRCGVADNTREPGVGQVRVHLCGEQLA